MDEKITIFSFVKRKIAELDADTASARAACARLRRAVGKPLESCADIWDFTISGSPEQWNSFEGKPSREEKAVHTALTLYALHRQSKASSMSTDNVSFGSALAKLKQSKPNSEEAIKRRFNAAATSVDYTELSYHVRGLVSLLKSDDIKMDYPRFAVDLFWFQFPEYADRVRLRWGEDFYRSNDDKKGSDDE